MSRKALALFTVGLLLLLINIGFYNNLKNFPEVNYYLLLLAINIDLLALIIIIAVVLRKLIKVYLGTRRNILRRKLANIMFLYLFLPVLLLNTVFAIFIVQTTKSYFSSKTFALSNSSKEVYQHLYDLEVEKINTYKRVITTYLSRNLIEEIRNLEGVRSVIKVSECEYEVSEGEFSYTLCLDSPSGSFKVEIEKDLKLIRDISEFGQLAGEVRAFVKTRDIITGVFVFLIVFIALITLLGTVWLGMLVARHISQPIENLSEKAMKIAQGDLETEIEEVRTGDEIERLSVAFKKMKENLKEIYARLKMERDLLEKLLDALPVGVLYVGRKGEIIRINRTFVESFASKEEAKNFLESASKSKNFRVERIKGEEGDIYIVEDISSIVLAERFTTWQEAVKRIAHEIKNPLTPIRLNLERLKRYSEKDELDRDRLRELVNVILKELDRISELVNQFKSLSPSKELHIQELKISEVIKSITRLYSSAGIEVNLEGDRVVQGDIGMIREMFLNLINNSIEWGAKRIDIVVNENRLDYRDNGKGIEEGMLENIFIPYFSNNPKGMGIGMAVVKRIVEDHGWEIRALPSERGAHFVIDFISRNSRA